ncbi:unnamed protein product [Amoebophrya sp. A25]|nr:unnamed protein product [Amoebophrya sp. A25]|eukprot:GSA25T00018354001.1
MTSLGPSTTSTKSPNKKAMTMTSLPYAPREVSLHIISFLDMQSLTQFEACSKECRDIAHDFLRVSAKQWLLNRLDEERSTVVVEDDDAAPVVDVDGDFISNGRGRGVDGGARGVVEDDHVDSVVAGGRRGGCNDPPALGRTFLLQSNLYSCTAAMTSSSTSSASSCNTTTTSRTSRRKTDWYNLYLKNMVSPSTSSSSPCFAFALRSRIKVAARVAEILNDWREERDRSTPGYCSMIENKLRQSRMKKAHDYNEERVFVARLTWTTPDVFIAKNGAAVPLVRTLLLQLLHQQVFNMTHNHGDGEVGAQAEERHGDNVNDEDEENPQTENPTSTPTSTTSSDEKYGPEPEVDRSLGEYIVWIRMLELQATERAQFSRLLAREEDRINVVIDAKFLTLLLRVLLTVEKFLTTQSKEEGDEPARDENAEDRRVLSEE